MYGCAKSDPVIVAVKPTNNARRLAAELGERRAGAEGNASQQSTRRAQDRESVPMRWNAYERSQGKEVY